MDIRYRTGQFVLYIASRTFTLGGTGVQVYEGTEVKFDGTKAIVNETEYMSPTLRGAVKQGWLVPEEQYDENDPNNGRPAAAPMMMGPTEHHGNDKTPRQRFAVVTLEDDMRVVGGVGQHAQQVRQHNTDNRNTRVASRGQPRQSVTMGGQNGQQYMEQEGDVVRGFKTPTVFRTKLDGNNTGTAIRHAEQASRVDAGEGMSETEMFARMEPHQRQAYIDDKRSHALRKEGVIPEHVEAQLQALVQSAQPRQPRQARQAPAQQQARHQTSQEYQDSFQPETQQARQPRQPDRAPGRSMPVVSGEHLGVPQATAQPRVEVREIGGIKFTTTNGPTRDAPQPSVRASQQPQYQPPPQPQQPAYGSPQLAQVLAISADEAKLRLKMAKRQCADFPSNYDFGQTAKKKLARIVADYEDREDVIQAIWMAETDDFKPLLADQFPAIFAA